MKYISFILFTCISAICCCPAMSQVYNNGAMYIPEGANAAAFGDFTNNDTGAITNAGDLYALFNITNKGITGYDSGTLHLWGYTPQILDGTSSFLTTNLDINNSSGDITLNKRYSVSHQAQFLSGIVHVAAGNEPLEFNPGGNGSTAILPVGVSDVSHVDGYTAQLGTGNFIYPVGDDVMYQPVGANLSLNTNGMLCHYTGSDAGNAPFLTTGLSNMALLFYNQHEYWDLSPSGQAKGSVSIYYDGYNDMGIGTDYASALKVAHKVPSGWNNEGGNVNGTQLEGSVTSAGEITTWSPFTLGSITNMSPLPTEILDFAATRQACEAILSWSTGVENDVIQFEVQYSTDGLRFKTVGTVTAHGSGGQYTFTYTPMNGRVYFRLAIRDGNGAFTFTKTLTLNMNCKGEKRSVTVYPNPVTYGNRLHVNLSGYQGQVTGILYDIAGRQIYIEPLANGINTIDMDKIAVGTYQLCIVSAGNTRETYKIVVTN